MSQTKSSRHKDEKTTIVRRDSSSGKFVLKRSDEKEKGFPSNRLLKQGELPKR